MLYSFDVFDTLIARTTATPYGIFAVMHQRLMAEEKYQNLPYHIRYNFYTLRIQAEKVARFHSETDGIEEITLSDIYMAMSMAGELDAVMQEQLCRLEQEIELDNVLPIIQNIKKLKQQIKSGNRVILVSDMYLSQDMIRKILIKTDEIFRGIPLYVSSELKVKKTTGNLYQKVRDIENIQYRDWTHYGDNQHQDIEMAKRLGIHAVHLKPKIFMRHEKRFLKYQSDNAVLQLLIGQASYTRYADGLKTTAERMGSSICGPLIYCYANWILRECECLGIKRLYFIARDGYLAKVAADSIIKNKGLQIETHYIYGSRKAWKMCSLRKEYFNLLKLIAWSYPEKIRTTQDLADTLELTVTELADFLPYGCRKADTELSRQSLVILVKRLECSGSFQTFYLNKQKEKRNLAVQYLQQQVDVTDNDFAFVDASGTGLNQGCLHQLMMDFYVDPIHSFFFRLDKVNMSEGCVYHVFFPNGPENRLLAEMLFRAPHGQTVAYEREDKKIIPVFDDFEGEYLLQHGFKDQQRAMELFVSRMVEAENRNSIVFDSLAAIELYFQYMSVSPDKETLEYFATFPDDETGQRGNLLEYAPKLSKEDILNIFVRKMYWENIRDYYKGSCLAYSLLRCSKEERELVRKCKQEYDAEWGIRERSEKIVLEQEYVERYGRAAYYPCELFEKNIVLYGAGKFGRELYHRLQDQSQERRIRWVDKKIAKNKNTLETYPDNIESVEGIEEWEFDQVIIAVLNEGLAEEIRFELKQKGIPEEKIFWVPVYFYRNVSVSWREG